MEARDQIKTVLIALILSISWVAPGYAQKGKIKKQDALNEISYIIDNAYEFLGKSSEQILNPQWITSLEGEDNWEILDVKIEGDTIQNPSNFIGIVTRNGLILLMTSKNTKLVSSLTYIPDKKFNLKIFKIVNYLMKRYGNELFMYSTIHLNEDRYVYLQYLSNTIMIMAQNRNGEILFRDSVKKDSIKYFKIDNIEDFENVTFTTDETIVSGFTEIGDVNAKAKGATIYSDQTFVTMRAIKKIQIEAAMMGANIIYLKNGSSKGVEDNYFSWSRAETSFSGVAYSNQLPLYSEFIKLVGDKTRFNVVMEYTMKLGGSNYKTQKVNKELRIDKIMNKDGIVIIIGQIVEVQNLNNFMVSYLTKDSFNIYYRDESTAYSYMVRF